jgi:hypothetical protein
MKIFNLQRGRGKTTRMLYASEFNNAPILCYNTMYKQNVIDMANKFGINIPEPMTVSEFIQYKKIHPKSPMPILIDEMDITLSLLLLQAFNTEVIGATITTDK